MLHIPPPGVRIRSVMRGFTAPGEAIKIFDYDPERIMVIFYEYVSSPGYLIVARAYGDVHQFMESNLSFTFTSPIYGPEEIWVAGSNAVEVSFLGSYQALYYA